MQSHTHTHTHTHAHTHTHTHTHIHVQQINRHIYLLKSTYGSAIQGSPPAAAKTWMVEERDNTLPTSGEENSNDDGELDDEDINSGTEL